MKQEMRKLNRAKYACSEEEVKRLTAEGYVPVGKKAAAPEQQDTEPEQSAEVPGQKDRQTAVQPEAVGKKDKKPKKPAAAPDQKDDGAEQPAAVTDPAGADEDGNKK